MATVTFSSAPSRVLPIKQIAGELWLHILGELEFRHILRCRQVCSYWKSLIDHSATILYKVWLGIHGKINRPWASKNLSVADRMADLLMAEELGWSTLTFPRRDSLSYFQEQVRIMGFGGTCEKASNRHPDDKGHLTLGPLPTAASREPFQFHADKIFDSSRPEYTQDPTLDVLIFLCSVRGKPPAFGIRSLRDPSKPHDFAAVTTLDTKTLVPDDGREWIFSKTALVSDKFVLKADSTELSILIIWNWIRGEVLVRLELPLRPNYICGGLSLVSNHTFIVPIVACLDDSQPPTAYIELYEFDDRPWPASSPSGTVGSSPLPSSLPPHPRHVRTFLLPEMSAANITVPDLDNPEDDIMIDLDPLDVDFDFYCFSLFHNALSLASDGVHPVSPSKSQSAALIGGLDRPSEHEDTSRLCHLILEVHLGHALPSQCYDFFVYTSTFTSDPPSVLKAYQSNSNGLMSDVASPAPLIPWEDWGVANAAAFCSLSSPHDYIDIDVSWHARGDRVAVADVDRQWAHKQTQDRLRRGGRQWRLRVLDFRPDRVRRAKLLLERAEDHQSGDSKVGGLAGIGSSLWPPPLFAEGKTPFLPVVKTSFTDELATPEDYDNGYIFKHWPIRAELPYIETFLDKKFQGLWMDVEMDGDHLITNCNVDVEDGTVEVEILSM